MSMLSLASSAQRAFSPEALDMLLTAIVARYEQTAPTVARWADDMYIRLNESPETVTVAQIMCAQHLLDDDGEWELPSYAANRVYKRMAADGQDVTGHAGF